ncbi:hypothetical protein ACFLY6_00840 [Candidatus Dependentiae bacterium]
MKKLLIFLLISSSANYLQGYTLVESQTALDTILRENRFVVVGFFAENHGLSKFVQKIEEKAEKSAKGVLGIPVKFVRVNFDTHRFIANRYNVTEAASYLFFKERNIAGRAGSVAVSSPNESPKRFFDQTKDAFKITETDKKNSVKKEERPAPTTTPAAPVQRIRASERPKR